MDSEEENYDDHPVNVDPTPASPPPGQGFDEDDFADNMPTPGGDDYLGAPPLHPGEVPLDEYAQLGEYAVPPGDLGPPADNMAYDFPGEPPPPVDQLGQSTNSLGFGGASASSLPEEIDVNTHGLIDETVQRLSFIHGVLGVLIIDREGLIVHATMPMDEAAQLTGPTLQLLSRAREVAKLRPDDDFQMLTVRTRKHEMLLCSEANGAFAVMVIQDPQPQQDGSSQPSLVFAQQGGGEAGGRSIVKGASLKAGA